MVLVDELAVETGEPLAGDVAEELPGQIQRAFDAAVLVLALADELGFEEVGEFEELDVTLGQGFLADDSDAPAGASSPLAAARGGDEAATDGRLACKPGSTSPG